MRTGTKHTIRQGLAIALAAIASGLPTQSAFAGSTYQNSFCDAFCNQLVDPSNGKVLGLNGQDGWTAADDAACAEQSGASTAPAPVASASPVPMPSTKTQAFQCQWHAGQALNYCEAYEAPQASQGFQKILLALDVTSAGLCWTACATSIVPAGAAVCAGSATVASVTDFVDSLKMKSSGLYKAIETAAAAGTAAWAVAGQAVGTVNSAGQVTWARQSKQACYTAAAMTVLAALRLKDMNSATNTEQNACNSIQSLYSNAPTISNTGAVPVGTGSTGTSLPAPGAMEASGPLSDGRQMLSAGCASQGLGSGGCGFSPKQLSAPDAKILDSGLGAAIAPQAAQQQGAILGTLGSGGPNALGQNLAAGAPNGDIAKAISTLAAEAAKDPGSLGASGESGAGGGAGGGSSNQASAWNFGAQDTAPVAGPAVKSFAPVSNAQPASGDIYHTGYKGSLFDIISQRMTAVRNRVDQLPWSTPLNRALAGSDEAAPAPAQGVGR